MPTPLTTPLTDMTPKPLRIPFRVVMQEWLPGEPAPVTRLTRDGEINIASSGAVSLKERCGFPISDRWVLESLLARLQDGRQFSFREEGTMTETLFVVNFGDFARTARHDERYWVIGQILAGDNPWLDVGLRKSVTSRYLTHVKLHRREESGG